MDFATLLLINAAVTAGCMLLLWIISLPLRDVSIVDLFWGPGFVVTAWVSFLLGSSSAWQAILLVALVTIWGLRLGLYLAWRNIGKGEDYRYREMRDKPGRNFALFSLFVVFGLQGTIMWLVSFPLQMAPTLEAQSLPTLSLVAIAVWLFGFSFEVIGDWQLAKFKADPANKGKVLDTGLWRYTRHPNYFGDSVMWWAYYLLVVSISTAAWWTFTGPLLMTFCLLYFSGVAHLETRLKQRRPKYADYIERTSSFFPWPPKKSSQQSAAAMSNNQPTASAGN